MATMNMPIPTLPQLRLIAGMNEALHRIADPAEDGHAAERELRVGYDALKETGFDNWEDPRWLIQG